MPWEVAEVNDSTQPSNTRTSVYLVNNNSFDLFTRFGAGNDAVAEGEEIIKHAGLAYAAVPPTVNARTRSVGVPSPTGTP